MPRVVSVQDSRLRLSAPGLCLWLTGFALAQPEPAVFAHNPSGHEQVRVLRVAWPVPRHWGVRDVRAARVGREPAACVVRLRWPDQTLAVVELRWRARLAAGERAVLRVECEFERDHLLPATLAGTPAPPVMSSIDDPFGRRYVAELRADAGEVSASAWHRDSSGAGMFAAHAFWGVHGNPERELTIALDNGRWSAGVLGPARLQSWRVQCDGFELWPADSRSQQARDGDALVVLGPSPWLYLGDATAKVSRCYAVPSGLSEPERRDLAATLAAPAYALPELDWLRWCGVYGLHGGPAPSRGPIDDLSVALLGRFYATAEFGPFGGYGDHKSAVDLGSSRHGDSVLHNVLRFPSSALLAMAEGAVQQGALRPPPGHSARLPGTGWWLAGLSRRAIEHPHGFEPFDYEHVAVDACFELYWLTGDPVALRELHTVGRAIRDLLGRLPFLTCRGEAVCLRGLVACAWATGDRDLLDFARARVRQVLAAKLREHPVAAIAQPPHREGLGDGVWFDVPWQMAMLLCSLHALHRLEPDDQLVAMIESLARRLVGPCWLEGVGPKYLVAARDANQFAMARQQAPLSGTAHFLLAALTLASEVVGDDLRTQLEQRIATIVAAARDVRGVLPPQIQADPWWQVWGDRTAAAR